MDFDFMIEGVSSLDLLSGAFAKDCLLLPGGEGRRSPTYPKLIFQEGIEDFSANGPISAAQAGTWVTLRGFQMLERLINPV